MDARPEVLLKDLDFHVLEEVQPIFAGHDALHGDLK